MKKVWLVLMLLCISFIAVETSHAALVTTNDVTISNILAYGNFGNGDVVVTFATGITGCESGFWINPSQPGYKTLSAIIMAAYLSKSTVQITGDNNVLWTGSAAHYCQIYMINLR